jgi:hypothetical protein
VVTLSSSDTDKELELLFLSRPRHPISHISEPSPSSDSDQFEDWPEANDMAMSAYVALTVDVSSCHASTVNALRGNRKFYWCPPPEEFEKGKY